MVKNFETQLKNVAFHYAEILGCKITESTLRKDLETNPFYPSVACLTKIFSKYKVPNQAFKMKASKLHILKAPFIALYQVTEQLKDFVLITEITKNHASFCYGNKKVHKVDLNTFEENFREIVFIAEPTPDSGELGYEKKIKTELRNRYKTNGLMAMGIFIFLYFVYANFSFAFFPFFLLALMLKTSGCVVTFLLLMYDIDKNNLFLKNICESDDNGKFNCDSVIHSKGAKIWGISWSEIGFTYFISTLLLFLFPVTNDAERLFYLTLFNAFAAPFIGYSLYYQWKIVKKWCKLCLTVLAILFLELLMFLFFYWSHIYLPSLNLFHLGTIGICLMLPMMVLFSLKTTFIKSTSYQSYFNAYLRLKNHPDYFSYELHKQPLVTEGWEEVSILLGNPEGATIVISVSDLYCTPCAMAFPELEDLIIQNKNIQWRMIFKNTVNAAEGSDRLAKHILSMAAQSEINVTVQAIRDWYQMQNYYDFARKYPITEEVILQQQPKLEMMQTWCNHSAIFYTPFYFIQGHQLPEIYAIEDLKSIY